MSEIFLPDTPVPAAIRVRPTQRTRASTAISGKMQSRLYGGQSYAVTLSYNLMRRDQAAPLIAFLHEMQGKHGIFCVRLPQLTGVDGLQIGNFVNFADDSKLHMIVGLSPLTVVPQPRVGGGTVDANSPYLRCSLAGDVQEIQLGRGGLIRLEINLVERL